MTLLITMVAAVIATVLWYKNVQDNMMLSTLCLMYWGASLMWLVDAFFAYFEQQASYFTPSIDVMVNDAFLGFCVVAFGLVIWVVRLLIADPQGRIRSILCK